MPDDLTRCPFCGYEAEVEADSRTDKPVYYTVGCSNFECLVGPMTALEENRATAVQSWETRACPFCWDLVKPGDSCHCTKD